MSYWVISSIPTMGLFATSDTRTKANFGNGLSYCDGARKLLTFSFANGLRRGFICHAGTALRHTIVGDTIIATENILRMFVSSAFFSQRIMFNGQKNAKNIFDILILYLRSDNFVHCQFSTETHPGVVNIITLEDMILSECTLGFGLISNAEVSVYGYKFINEEGAVKIILHPNENILMASNGKYEQYAFNVKPPTYQHELIRHREIVDTAKVTIPGLHNGVSNSYDQIHYPINGQAQRFFQQKVNNIINHQNYTLL